MENKNTYLAIGAIIVVVLVIVFLIKPNTPTKAPTEADNQEGVASSTPTQSSGKKAPVAKTTSANLPATKASVAIAPVVSYPEIDFINQELVTKVSDFSDVKITIEQIVFGRGNAAISTGCTGIPNINFSTYLYPGNSICLSSEAIDGAPRGILAFRLLVENNGNIGFGGNPDTFLLHYTRADTTGTVKDKFAHPLADFSNYYIAGYASKQVVLSYLVPEDQLTYDLISGYQGPSLENKNLSIYDLSESGIFIDFGSKNIKIVK